MDTKFPDITVGIVHSRDGISSQGITWFEKAIESIDVQLYPAGIDIIVIENMDRKKTIGSCYNEIAQLSKHDWIFYMGDDDYIKPEYLLSLMGWLIDRNVNDGDSFVQVSGYCTAFSLDYGDNGRVVKVPLQRIPQGIWKKDFILKNLFNDKLEKYVDTDLYQRTNVMEGVNMALVEWNYGYYYRQHKGDGANISGNYFENAIINGDITQEELNAPKEPVV